ncbi:response regulator transcription factor [Hymenobacter negativus]|uniref:Response regulator transcription factor n=1 Tax=Hymenobacter negativus TaxID=2795026 RepID=A0ABS0Q9G2_9BACT|nr:MULTISPECIES: response regulator transcription factor [Bacteria]MBH8559313.1 response regulator transcription factor [Hymenobacter negativus]MBH8568244.1 response regulator transcription factor [Hymenobacter negativus]MBR7207979.1 response regulator transcription factor [Microvirga sp. STS02]
MAILIIEAHDTRRNSVQRFLQRAGYVTDLAPTLAAATAKLAARHYEFVLLAQNLPDGDGMTLLYEAQRRGTRASFILLMATDAVQDRLHGFAAGADDCVARSTSLLELERRLRSIARQRFGRPRPRIRFGAGFELDLAARRLRHGSDAVDLSRSQFDLLHHLLRHRGQPLTREQLGAHIGKGTEGSNYIDVHIMNVRKALARFAPPDFLQTVRGIGYQAA